MPFAQLSSARLYYETHGSPNAPALVLLHGACETFQAGWNKQIAAFSQNYWVIGLDMRGHGQSDNPAGRLDFEQMADDVWELLRHLGRHHAHVAGFSGGGTVALWFGLRHTAALLSLIAVSNNMQRDDARIAAGFWNPERQRREEPMWWKTMEKIHTRNPAELLGWWEAEDTRRAGFGAADLAVIRAPALVVGGDRDPLIPLDQTFLLYRSLPNAQLAILPGVGHAAPRKPHLFNAIALDFLNRV